MEEDCTKQHKYAQIISNMIISAQNELKAKLCDKRKLDDVLSPREEWLGAQLLWPVI